jgi:hypothetical protein
MSEGVKRSSSNGFEKPLSTEHQQEKVCPSHLLVTFVTSYWRETFKLVTLSSMQVNEVKRLVGPLPEKLSIYCSDASIERHLRARNWNVKKALKMLKETLKWRVAYKPEEIRWVHWHFFSFLIISSLCE